MTLVPFVALWVAMWMAAQINSLYVLLLAIPAACFMLRLFMIQHDCGHGGMFSSRRVNDWVGRFLGILTLTPYDYWRKSHALHHASSGNLDRRGFGDIDTLTIEEYKAQGPIDRLKYRLYRHPVVMFGLGPGYLFLFRHRWPTGAIRQGRASWMSAIWTNLAIAVVSAILIYAVGFGTFLLIQLPIVLIGASIGVWLFYVQHQFDPTHWERSEDWSHENAALHGSSYYDLPKPLMWLTGNIGIHHIHHLSSRIPYHRLPQVLKDHPELKNVSRLTFWESLKCVRLALWDEEAKRLVSFREAAGRLATA